MWNESGNILSQVKWDANVNGRKIKRTLKKYTFWKYANLYFQSADCIEFAQNPEISSYFSFFCKKILTNVENSDIIHAKRELSKGVLFNIRAGFHGLIYFFVCILQAIVRVVGFSYAFMTN